MLCIKCGAAKNLIPIHGGFFHQSMMCRRCVDVAVTKALDGKSFEPRLKNSMVEFV